MKKLNNLIILFFLFNKFLFIGLFSEKNNWAEDTLKKLTLREKIGQLFMVATASKPSQDIKSKVASLFEKKNVLDSKYIEKLIKNYKVGGVMFLYRSTPSIQIQKTNRYQSLSKLPLLIAEDCEWGLHMRLDDTIKFPKNMTLGAITDPQLIYKVGREIGKHCKAVGVNLNFAPVVDINNNPNNLVINYRSFGENKFKVADYGVLFMKGLQSSGVLSCAKHFPGHGNTNIDSHIDLPTISNTKSTIKNLELFPFQELIKNGIDAIMTAHLYVPAYDENPQNPSSLSYKIVTELLKKELGFKGVVITDALNMGAVLKYFEPGDIELKAFLAGNDILLYPLDVPKSISLIETAIKEGKISLEELDRRVLKILKIKEDLCLNKNRFIDEKSALEEINNKSGYDLKRKLYEASITLVKNENKIIPLDSKNSKELVHIQIGGEVESDFDKTLRKNSSSVPLRLDSKFPLWETRKILNRVNPFKTIIISIFDMNKDAKENFGIHQNTFNLIKSLISKKKRVIISIFGSPYSLKFFKDEDAIIVAYEADPDAQVASAKVILGLLNPKGKLPITASKQFSEGLGLTTE